MTTLDLNFVNIDALSKTLRQLLPKLERAKDIPELSGCIDDLLQGRLPIVRCEMGAATRTSIPVRFYFTESFAKLAAALGA